jgi:hypothetical protein
LSISSPIVTLCEDHRASGPDRIGWKAVNYLPAFFYVQLKTYFTVFGLGISCVEDVYAPVRMGSYTFIYALG